MKISIYHANEIRLDLKAVLKGEQVIDLKRDYTLALELEEKKLCLNDIYLKMNKISAKNYERTLSVNDIIAIYNNGWSYYIIDMIGFTDVTSYVKK